MILNCFNINYFFLDFGNGYCVEMPSDKKDLDKLLDYLFSQKVEWKFYATLTGRKWFHGIYITFKNRKHRTHQRRTGEGDRGPEQHQENENDKVDPLTMAFTPLGTDQTSMDK